MKFPDTAQVEARVQSGIDSLGNPIWTWPVAVTTPCRAWVRRDLSAVTASSSVVETSLVVLLPRGFSVMPGDRLAQVIVRGEDLVGHGVPDHVSTVTVRRTHVEARAEQISGGV